MLLLSLWRPWPWAIFDPIANKGIENRDWQPAIKYIGQRVALQSGDHWDDRAITHFMRLGLTHFPARKEQYPKFVITGVATIGRIVTSDKTLPDNQKRWFFGPYGWILEDRIALETPVECKGFRGMRPAPAAVAEMVTTQLRRMGRLTSQAVS